MLAKEPAVKTFALMTLLLSISYNTLAEEYRLIIKDHRFQPAELTLPAGQKIKLLVENQDSTPEEFDSHDLNREKVIMGNSSATIFIGPLTPGRYTFIGEFHATTAIGTITAQ
jgi:plastocyanin